MNTRSFATHHAESSAKSFQIRTAETAADWQIAHQWLDQEHLLRAGREAGDRLCQFIVTEGEIVAVLVWCAAAQHLKDRDKMIGWDPVTRSQRLKLVVQLRRFLVLEKNRRPNLASQCLGLGLRELSSQWLNIAQNLALTRNALLAIIPFDEKRNLPSLISRVRSHGNIFDKNITKFYHASGNRPPGRIKTDSKSFRKISISSVHGLEALILQRLSQED